MPRASKASRAAKPVKKSPVRKAVSKTVKKAAPKKAAAKQPAAKKTAAATKTVKKAAPAKKVAPQKAVAKKAVTKTIKKAAPAKKAAPVKKAGKVVLDKFALEQRELLLAERATYAEQAEALKAEADQLAAEMEPGDIQFDDESGEGATATVDRERDLALSAQARQEIEEIDYALSKIEAGTYGTCESCGNPIPKARLKFIPHARLCVSCKSGGLSRR